MICPRPNTHDANPTAVPIKEAIKETFRVFMPHPRLLDTIKIPVSFHPDSAISPQGLHSIQRLIEQLCPAAHPGLWDLVQPFLPIARSVDLGAGMGTLCLKQTHPSSIPTTTRC
jgi:hypothetical protein